MPFSIGSCTPSLLPGAMTLIRPEKPNAVKQTYSSVAYFSWPATIIGKTIELNWNLLPAADFIALDGIYSADLPVVFDPLESNGYTYNVQIIALDGKYLLQRQHRADVVAKLLILSQA